MFWFWIGYSYEPSTFFTKYEGEAISGYKKTPLNEAASLGGVVAIISC